MAIIESVDGDWEGLQTYAVAKLGKKIHEYNRAPPDEKITPYVSESDADAVIKDGEKKFGEAQKDLVRFSKILLAIRYNSGLLTDNQFFSILKSWKNYVPMARVFDENEEYHGFDDLKRREGHTDDTYSPIQTMMANTHKIIQACERNKVKLEIANLVRFGGFDSNLSEVAGSTPDADNIIRFRENGKIKYLETPDPSIKRAIDALHSQSEGAWRAFTGKELTKEFIEWQMNGGAQASFVSGDVDYIQRSINDATTTRAQRYRKNFISQTLDDFQKISEFTENITRLTGYELAKKQLAKKKS